MFTRLYSCFVTAKQLVPICPESKLFGYHLQANERVEMGQLLAAPENAAPDAVIPEGEWKDCIFNTSVAGYRQPKRPSFLGNGQTACVFWSASWNYTRPACCFVLSLCTCEA